MVTPRRLAGSHTSDVLGVPAASEAQKSEHNQEYQVRPSEPRLALRVAREQYLERGGSDGERTGVALARLGRRGGQRGNLNGMKEAVAYM